MALEIYKKEQQASGQFNGGAILENKPIGFHRITDNSNHIQIFYIGHMPGHPEMIA